MKRTLCSLSIAAILIATTNGCGGGGPPKLDPEVAKERQQAYESKMRDGPPRGGQPSGQKK